MNFPNADLEQLINDDIFKWSVALIILNPSSEYHGGYFKGTMSFPSNYPYSPPTFRFDRPLTHPNIYPDGRLCISILHKPGEDEMSGESAGERWSPVQRVESVLLSIISLLDDAECSSPANVDAGVLLRNKPDAYRQLVRSDVEKSKADIPAGFVMPTSMEEASSKAMEKSQALNDSEFWVDSEDEDGFGGSDTDNEILDDEDEDQEDVEMQEDAEDQADEESDS